MRMSCSCAATRCQQWRPGVGPRPAPQLRQHAPHVVCQQLRHFLVRRPRLAGQVRSRKVRLTVDHQRDTKPVLHGLLHISCSCTTAAPGIAMTINVVPAIWGQQTPNWCKPHGAARKGPDGSADRRAGTPNAGSNPASAADPASLGRLRCVQTATYASRAAPAAAALSVCPVHSPYERHALPSRRPPWAITSPRCSFNRHMRKRGHICGPAVAAWSVLPQSRCPASSPLAAATAAAMASMAWATTTRACCR
jgi:hypothetical protein